MPGPRVKARRRCSTPSPGAVILRPSVVFGPEDLFFNKFAGMTRFGPFLPVVAGDTKFQPAYVDDVAAAAVMGVAGQAEAGVYELGGPDVASMSELMDKILEITHRRRVEAAGADLCGADHGLLPRHGGRR